MILNDDELTDEELLALSESGDERATDALMARYKYLVKYRAKSMYILGGDKDDLIQEGMIGLFKAIRDYDKNAKVKFATFASIVITRQLYDAVRASKRKKFSPLNEAVSLSGDEELGNFASYSPFLEESDPEKIYLTKEKIKAIGDFIENELSDLEKNVYELYISGMTYTEIAEVIGKDDKTADNAIQRVKAKIRALLMTI